MKATILQPEISEKQLHLIDLITTWEPKNVKLALELSRSQNIEIESIYRDFLEECDWLPHEYEGLFPIENCLISGIYSGVWVTVPKAFGDFNKVVYFIKRFVLLFGRCKHLTINAGSLYNNNHYETLEKEINDYFQQDGFLQIDELPF
jgi:hypothetical protein